MAHFDLESSLGVLFQSSLPRFGQFLETCDHLMLHSSSDASIGATLENWKNIYKQRTLGSKYIYKPMSPYIHIAAHGKHGCVYKLLTCQMKFHTKHTIPWIIIVALSCNVKKLL